MKAPRRLGSGFELLEDRSLPTTFGVPWADAEHLTISFVADGTQTPLGTSSLASVLNSAATSPEWKREILRAFQTWAMHANINIGIVADGGQALGSVGAVQGDSRFGDIRIAAAPLSADVLASASPFSWTGTSLSGDLILNSNAPFSLNSPAGYDLFSVAIHEAGHAFGIGHVGEEGGPCGCGPCTGFRSVMESIYARQTGLGIDDIAAIQKLYGEREADTYDAVRSNDTRATASAIPRSSMSQLLATGDLTTNADVDYYKFTAPALTSMLSSVTVRLKASGLSLLTASVTVYDSAGRVVASATSTDPLNNDLLVSFRPGLFGGNYTVKVEGAQDDAFGVGGYKLAVDFLSVGGLLFPITTALTGVLDGHTDDVLANALGVQTNKGGDARFDAIYRGVIEDNRDVDSYRIRTDKFAAGTSVTLNVMAWGLDANPVDARVRVYDANGNAVAFQVLSNDRGLFSVQVRNAVAGKDYFVQVSAREGAARTTGSYFFAADFNQLTPLLFENVASGAVTANTAAPAETITFREAGLFQFALGADSQQAGDALTMTVYDENGNAVFSLTATAGRPPVTASRYLNAGAYTVRYAGAGTNDSQVGYRLFMLQLSEGVGPYATSSASPPSSTAPSSTSSSPSSYPPTASSSGSSAPPPSSTTSAPPPSSGTSSTTTTSSSSPPPPSSTQESSYTYSGSSTAKPSGYYYSY